MKKQFTNFSITLHELNLRQKLEVEKVMEDVQRKFEKEYEVTGGDFVDVESGEFDA